MLLYKFKSSSGLLHLLDILVHQRLYCSPYQDLNDPFEGQFKTLVRTMGLNLDRMIDSPAKRILGSVELNLDAQPRIKYRQIRDLGIDEPRICSLCSHYSDVRMWSLYAESHQGVAIEIDFTGIEDQRKEVNYVDSLPKFGSTILTGPSAHDVLSCKTSHWRYEQEHRVFSDAPYFDVPGRITRVLLGIRTNDSLRELLMKVLPQNVQIVQMALDYDGAGIELGDVIERGV